MLINRDVRSRLFRENRGNLHRTLLFLVAAGCWAAPAWAQPGPLRVVPANFTARNDAQGFRWDFHQYGYIQKGTNNGFSNCCVLQINGSGFSPQSSTMTADGEYILTRTINNLQVTRRIKLDTKAAVVRYLEILHNPGPAPITANLMLHTSLARAQAQSVTTDTGTPLGAASNISTVLGSKDSGLIALGNPAQQQVSAIFYLSGPRSKVKPTMKISNRAQFVFTYSVTVPAGKTASILHGVAQRNLTSVPDAKSAAALFRPFRSRTFTAKLPSDVRRSIINLGGIRFGGGGDSNAFTTFESLDITPGPADILAVGEQTRLHGTASCSQLSINTRYGNTKLPLEKVAAIVGQKHMDGASRVFLRDGQVLRGELTIERLRFTMNTGLELELNADKLDRLVLQERPGDGRAALDVYAMIDTIDGDRLALVGGDELRLAATTPWGHREVPLDQILRLYTTEDLVGHRLILRDGSRLFAFLGGAALKLDTLSFGPQEFTPFQIQSLTASRVKEEDLDGPLEISAPHVLLAGENALVGQVELPALNFLASGQQIPLPPNQIRILRNITDDSELSAQGGAVFEAELWDGGTVSGRLRELVLPIRTGDRVARVPLGDILEVHVPSPTVPESVRAKVAELMRDLGHPDYQKRKAASESLASFGFLAKSQLSDALQQTSDPEVRRRIEALLEEIQQ